MKSYIQWINLPHFSKLGEGEILHFPKIDQFQPAPPAISSSFNGNRAEMKLRWYIFDKLQCPFPMLFVVSSAELQMQAKRPSELTRSELTKRRIFLNFDSRKNAPFPGSRFLN